MSKRDVHGCVKKLLLDLAVFWRRLIDELEKKSPDDVLPEIREALTQTDASLDEMKPVGC